MHSFLTTPDEEIYVVGVFGSEFIEEEDFWINEIFITKYLSDGSLDISFGENGFKHISIENLTFSRVDILLTSDNNLLITSVNNSLEATDDYGISLIKLDSEGNYITLFGNNGILNTDCGGCSGGKTREVDGELYVFGHVFGNSSILKKYSNLGVPVTSFGDNGIIIFDSEEYNIEIYDIQNDENQNIYLFIRENDVNNLLLKLDQSGNELANKYLNEDNIVESLGNGVYNDGSLYISGSYNMQEYLLKKYDSETFEIDINFGQEGTVSTDFGNELELGGLLIIHSDRLYQVGWVANDLLNAKFGITAHKIPNGESDDAFGQNGKVITDVSESMDIPIDVEIMSHDRLIVLNAWQLNMVCYKIYDGLSVEDISTDSKIQIAPNPTSNSFVINGLNSNQNQIQILDLTGKIIQEFQSIQNNQTLNLGSIPKGNYIIKIQSKGKIESKKLVVK